MAHRVAYHHEAGIERFQMTYEEYLAWADEDVRAEWVNGEMIAYVPPDKVHQDIALFLATILRHYVELRGLGEIMIAPFEMRLDAVNLLPRARYPFRVGSPRRPADTAAP